MADEKIIARFTADISEYKAKLIELENQLNEFSDKQKKGAEEQKKASAELATASQKRKAALQNEEAELKRLQTALKQAFTVKDIETFNKKIAQSKANISVLKGEVGGIGKIAGGLGSQFAALGAGIAAAFTVGAVIQFGKESVKAFIEAEENAQRLRNAVVSVAKDSEAAFQELIEQSSRLQQITIFDDDSIQRTQTQLLNFGLTVDQVKRLTPAILDLAKANKIDLGQATDIVIQGINGQTRALRPLGIAFKDTGDKAENLDSILGRINSKWEGQSKNIETTADKLKTFQNRVAEFSEQVGGVLVDAFDKVTSRLFDFKNKGLAALFDLNPIVLFRSLLSKSADELKAEGDQIARQVKEQQLANVRKLSDEQLAEQIKYQERNINLLYKAAAEAINSGDKALATARQNQITVLQSQLDNLNKVADERANAAEIKRQDEEAARLKAAEEAAARAKKAAEQAAKAKEEQFQREAKAIEVAANNERSIAAALATDEEDLKKRLTAITEDELGRQLELYNKFGKDTSDIIEKITQLNISGANDRIKESADIFNQLVDEAKKSGEQQTTDYFDQLKKRREREIEVRNAAVDIAQELSDAIFEIQKSNADRRFNLQLSELDAERQRATSSKRLTEAEKLQIEKEYDLKEKQLKKKKFEDDKRLALAQAAINGALAVIKIYATATDYYSAAIQAALVIAQTAAEIAIISSQKYAKGTKKAKGGMAMVGEEGPEFMYVPNQAKILTAKQTRQHSGIIDAIYDNRLEKLIYQDHVLPALEKQKQDFAKRRDQSFADNLSRSLIFQGLTGKEMDKIRRKGTAITNTDELAEKIAAIISKGIDRRRMI